MRLTEQQYLSLKTGRGIREKKKHKYGAKRKEVNGISFDSTAEALRYQELLLLERSGVISFLVLQPSFVLIEGFSKGSKKYRPIIYKADFQYEEPESDIPIVEDVKGVEPPVFAMKKKMFIKKYGNDYTLRISNKKAEGFRFKDF